MKENLVEFGKFIEKGNTGEIVLVGFPHYEPKSRNLKLEKPGRYLGPHCLMRFLPKISFLEKDKIPPKTLSHLGDVIRPKQFLEHQYQTLKSTSTHEELLEFTENIMKEKIFNLNKELIFNGSYFDAFPYLVKSDLKKETHYNETNIRSESCMRFLVECFIEQKIENVKIVFLGTKKRFITKNEEEFFKKNQRFIEFFDNAQIDEGFIETFFEELLKKKNAEFYFGFSFNVVDPQYYWGRNHLVLDSNFNNKLLMSVFRKMGLMRLKVLSFFDFNPQVEDIISGVFYSTLIFEYLSVRLGLENGV